MTRALGNAKRLLHGVEDGKPRRNRATRRVDVERDVLVGILRLEKQHLRHHQIRGAVHDRPHQEDHPLTKQPRIDVVGTFAPTAGLDHDGDEAQALRLLALRKVSVDEIFDERVTNHGKNAPGK
jgi:hypothetical protein